MTQHWDDLRRLVTPASAEPTAIHGIGRARVTALVTALCAAVALAWSLNIAPGNRFFYPATLLVAAIYAVGAVIAPRLTRTPLPWRVQPRAVRPAVVVGLGLAALFCAGASLVRYVPYLQQPVARLLAHAEVGNLWLVALTTVVNGIAEETFYRGVLWPLFAPRTRVWLTTVAYTAVTAAAGISLLALAAAALGLAAALLRQRDRSLFGPILVHLVWSLTMLFVLPHIVS